MKELRVLPHGDKAVLDSARCAASGRYHLVGRRLVRAESIDKLPPEAKGEGVVIREREPAEPGDRYYVEAWVPTGRAAVVPGEGQYAKVYLDALREGGLVPADSATAKAAGVEFVSGPAKAEPKSKKGGE